MVMLDLFTGLDYKWRFSSITFHREAWFNSLFENPFPWTRLFSAVQSDWSAACHILCRSSVGVFSFSAQSARSLLPAQTGSRGHLATCAHDCVKVNQPHVYCKHCIEKSVLYSVKHKEYKYRTSILLEAEYTSLGSLLPSKASHT